jgi:hypothetical protein
MERASPAVVRFVQGGSLVKLFALLFVMMSAKGQSVGEPLLQATFQPRGQEEHLALKACLSVANLENEDAKKLQGPPGYVTMTYYCQETATPPESVCHK